MRLHSLIANLVTRRRGAVWFAVALICALSAYVLVTRMTLDSEVLNLLPSGFESVEGLKVYNRDFAQVRELTFALACQPDAPGSGLGGRLGLGVRRGEWCRGEQQPAGGDHREVSYWHVLHSSAQSYICARSDSYVEGFAGKAGADRSRQLSDQTGPVARG